MRALLPAMMLLLSLPQAALAEAVGQVVAVIGLVERIAIDGARVPLKADGAIHLGDRLLSGADGRAKLMLRDDSILKLSPSSELHINEQLIGPSGESSTGLGLVKGRVRALLGRKLGAASRFEITTPVAVAGVRGTDFEVWSNGRTVVRCYEGRVAVRNIDEAVAQEVLLEAGMFTSVSEGLAPSAPRGFTPGAATPGVESVDPESEGEDAQFEQLELELPGIEPLPPQPELGLSLPQRQYGFDWIIEEPLYGDISEQQQGTTNEPSDGGLSLPINIQVPLP